MLFEEILMLGRDDVEIEIRVRGFRWWWQGREVQVNMGPWIASRLIYGANELSHRPSRKVFVAMLPQGLGRLDIGRTAG